MTATAEATMACPSCGHDMNLEGRIKMDLAGADPLDVQRFHCHRCRKFYNVAPERMKK